MTARFSNPRVPVPGCYGTGTVHMFAETLGAQAAEHDGRDEYEQEKAR